VVGVFQEDAAHPVDPLKEQGGALLFTTPAGRCIPDAEAEASAAECRIGTFSDPGLGGTCALSVPSACTDGGGCPPGTHCRTASLVAVASTADTDADGVPDTADPRSLTFDRETPSAARAPWWKSW
jgi:hypothetical protein